ncbi:hypothetical protein ASPTUDRAFT_39618 [Aspergillus tubingensis CBS 134.48]|uniref:Uncharacterized protein n=1 Tax=Aspergillus tubingensis (strain CBS 134.48) TaxID=767770 RepID=A0A1L9NBK8_ASPTC|nr:hypothetical protein ASPTUDRAFT_39618 [Aspergillus tubingensis CBS 134.48]
MSNLFIWPGSLSSPGAGLAIRPHTKSRACLVDQLMRVPAEMGLLSCTTDKMAPGLRKVSLKDPVCNHHCGDE